MRKKKTEVGRNSSFIDRQATTDKYIDFICTAQWWMISDIVNYNGMGYKILVILNTAVASKSCDN